MANKFDQILLGSLIYYYTRKTFQRFFSSTKKIVGTSWCIEKLLIGLIMKN